MFGRCAFRLRQCIHFARKRGVLSGRSAAGSGRLVARYRQVHAPCEVETWNGHERRSAKQAYRCGVLGYKGARRTRLAQSSPFRADAIVNRRISNHVSPRTGLINTPGGKEKVPQGLKPAFFSGSGPCGWKPHPFKTIYETGTSVCGSWADNVSAVSEANGTTVPVSLDLRVRFRYSR